MEDGIYAKIKTNKGDITLVLHYDKTPGTVANFINLSEGLVENSRFKKLYKIYQIFQE